MEKLIGPVNRTESVNVYKKRCILLFKYKHFGLLCITVLFITLYCLSVDFSKSLYRKYYNLHQSPLPSVLECMMNSLDASLFLLGPRLPTMCRKGRQHRFPPA